MYVDFILHICVHRCKTQNATNFFIQRYLTLFEFCIYACIDVCVHIMFVYACIYNALHIMFVYACIYNAFLYSYTYILCVCIYIHMYIYIYIVCMLCMRVRMCVRMYVCTYADMLCVPYSLKADVCAFISIHMYTCVYGTLYVDLDMEISYLVWEKFIA
jgi:hypothetical protein